MPGRSRSKRHDLSEEEKEEEDEFIFDNEEEEECEESPPTSINPYTVLNLSKTASQSEIKSAYRRLALKTHPDKVPDSEKTAAHAKFQELAFAFAILSDERRRCRYDTTGRTEESLAENDDDGEAFNWTDFFRAQFAEVVTAEKISGFQQEYKGGEEEKRDLIAAYERFKGDMNKVYNVVMLSDAENDEERFREVIREAIESGEVEEHKKFTEEKESTWRKRIERARKRKSDFERKQKEDEEELGGESDEDEDEVQVKKSKKAKAIGKAGKKKGDKAGGDMGDLAALIQQRQQGRAENFFDSLEAKYGGGAAKGKKRASEPPEKAFQKNQKRSKKAA
ncbi:DnaJ-domain-containing protein [Polychaeton citri CBS 116435]|uniref:DnaJ-domain-containing protein n=1 Tax=Polychaeton citri CBS 116435 TaxID=1314669 RepID=A0A9P4Q5H8_9PEZI|nr:DnaJ-domain-containing protein [Polychaeton citri CBS 116435]